MQMAAVWYFEQYYGNSIWFFPFMTLGGALLLCLIEIKSIYEKAEDKVRMDKAGQTVSQLVLHRDNIETLAEVLGRYFKEGDTAKAETSARKKRNHAGAKGS